MNRPAPSAAARGAPFARIVLTVAVWGLASLWMVVAWFLHAHSGVGRVIPTGFAFVAAGLALAPWWGRPLARGIGEARLVLLGCGVVIPCVAVEAAARLQDVGGYLYHADAQRYFHWMEFDDDGPPSHGASLSHRHPPDATLTLRWGTVETDAFGWRRSSHHPASAAKDDPLRILALGDSFIFGWGLTGGMDVCAQLEKSLAGARADAVEVHNAGHGSHDLIDAALMFHHHVDRLQPDAVVLLTVENDFARPAWRDQVERFASLEVANPELVETLRAHARPRPDRSGPSEGLGRVAYGWIAQQLHRSFLMTSVRRVATGPAASRTAHWASQVEALREVVLGCRARGLPCVIAAWLPQAPDVAAALDESLQGETSLVHLRPPEDVDPCDWRLSAADSHWNAAGAAWAGTSLAAALDRRLGPGR